MHVDRKTLRQVFLGVAACIILYWLLHETERVKSVWNFIITLISPFLVGSALAFVLNVPLRGIERWFGFVKNKPTRRSISIVLTFVFVGLVIYFVFRLLLPQLIETVQNLVFQLPVFLNNVVDWVKDFLAKRPEIMQWVQSNTNMEAIDWSGLVEKAVSMAGDGATAFFTSVFAMIGALFTGIFNAVISVVFAIYCLARKEILARQFRRMAYSFLPERFCDKTIRILRLTNSTFSNFISGQCVEACILGSLFAIAMSIFRMPYIPLISVLIAVTALVPIVGAFVGCVLGAFFILVNDPIQAIWFVVMFLALQQFENNVIYPKVVGKSVGLPGMWVLLAVTVGGELMGVAGMLLMIPVTSVLYSLLREITAKRLDTRCIDNSKLQDQPSPVRNRLVDRHKKSKDKRLFRKKSAEVKKARVESENQE
jgi:predicted PurR-regulated permease PerM